MKSGLDANIDRAILVYILTSDGVVTDGCYEGCHAHDTNEKSREE